MNRLLFAIVFITAILCVQVDAACDATSCGAKSTFGSECGCATTFWFFSSCKCAARTSYPDQLSFAGDVPNYIVSQDLSFVETAPCVGCGTTTKTKFKTQLYILDRKATTVRQAIGTPMVGQGYGGQVYFYAKAGYILTSVTAPPVTSGTSVSTARTWYLTRLTGERITIQTFSQVTGSTTICNPGVLPKPNQPEGPDNERTSEDCPLMDIIPSPDGTVIAIVHHTVTAGNRSIYNVRVRLFKSTTPPTTSFFDQTYDFKTATSVPFWTTKSELIVSSPNLIKSITVAGAASTITTAPSCIYPPTSSSGVNLAGESMSIADMKTKVITFTSGADFVFGCRTVAPGAASWESPNYKLTIVKTLEIEPESDVEPPPPASAASSVTSSIMLVTALMMVVQYVL